MATKMSNKHLYTVMLNANKYYTPDIFITLSHLSVEMKDDHTKRRFIIQTGDANKNSLVNILKSHMTISRQTIVNCLNEVEELGILQYSEDLLGWELVDMIDMLQEGYTEIKDVLLEDAFSCYKLREKKLLLYMCHLLDTKGSTDFSRIKGVDFIINVKSNDSMWRKILRTKSIYYAKHSVAKFLSKVEDKIEDMSTEKRKFDFRHFQIKQFIFYCNAPNLRKKYDNETWIQVKYATELEMIKQYIKETDITLSKQKIYQIAHGIGVISSWVLKEHVCRCIIKKYIAIQKHASRVDINSLPAYIAAIIKNLTYEINKLMDSRKLDLNSINLDEIDIAI